MTNDYRGLVERLRSTARVVETDFNPTKYRAEQRAALINEAAAVIEELGELHILFPDIPESCRQCGMKELIGSWFCTPMAKCIDKETECPVRVFCIPNVQEDEE